MGGDPDFATSEKILQALPGFGADIIEIGRKLLRGARLRAFAQQLGGDGREAFFPRGVSDGTGFHDGRDVDERNAVFFEQQNC